MKILSSVLLKEALPTAIKISIAVGSILALINHYPVISSGLTLESMAQILLTYLVPYSVSTYASIKVILSNDIKVHKKLGYAAVATQFQTQTKVIMLAGSVLIITLRKIYKI